MKNIFKILFTLIVFISIHSTSFASVNWDSQANLDRINRIGNTLISKNKLDNRNISFKVSNTEDVNAYANINREVYVFKGLLNYVDYDHELAGVIAHEMGHIINGHCAKQTILNNIANSTSQTLANSTDSTTGIVAIAVSHKLTTSKLSRSDEFEADLTGVDLMVKAGYNPLAMISVLNKISGNYVDVFQSHPSGEKRLMNVYDYISYNYPQYAKLGANGYNTESYKKASTMIEYNLEKRKKNPKLQKKYEKKQQKLLKKKEKRIKKMANSISGWEASYATLYLMGK